MAENLAKFNSAMSQFQSGQEGINNYLNSRASDLKSFASSAIADKIGIGQEDKQAMDEAVGLITGAAPVAIAALSDLKKKAFPKKTAGKGAETSTTEAAKGEATETGSAAAKGEATGGEEVGAEEAGTVAKAAPKSILKSGEGGEEASSARTAARTPWESAEPAETAETPGVSFASEELGATPGGAANEAEQAADAATDVGEAGAEGAAESAAATEGASLLSMEGAAAAIPVIGEVAVVAAAGYAIYDGIKSLLGGGGEHKSAVKAAFSGDIAGSGESSAFTTGSYAVASNDGITTQTGGSGAF